MIMMWLFIGIGDGKVNPKDSEGKERKGEQIKFLNSLIH